MPELSSLEGMLCLETSMELMDEAEKADLDFVDSFLVNADSIEEEDIPYV